MPNILEYAKIFQQELDKQVCLLALARQYLSPVLCWK